ncbi:Ig-like domain (group 3) [Granulicella pectinivorans]|uniref:Ig-like domain (Group 3) n=1 Tax=Granulicella pectinivorans TaxID=474950 RepID=A0A1I6MS76_9BACT|nr:protease pro-enzyme activation domain-containing protein [Granulicella pectinivorans]SFS18539.1 Ig-like domain (group 3) [Granulicella pectinivorans]
MFDRLKFKASLLSLPAIALLAATSIPNAQAAVQNRITASLATESNTSLEGTVSPRARLAADLGAADPKLALTGMTLRFNLTDAQQAALTELLLEQQQPASANYHKWLTPEQFADQFGLSTSDIAKVTAWLSSQGFTVTGTARSRTFVTFSGTAAQVEQAFGTSIHSLSLDGEKHFANLSNPVLPTALAGVVSGITGLNDFKLVSRVKTRTVAAPAADALHPQFTSSISGNTFVAPGDFYTIYDVNPLLSNNVNGSGITIAVMGQTDISLSDVAAFRTASGLIANVPTVQLYGTDPGTSTNDLTEAQLDVEWSGAAAPSASILYVNSTDVIGTSLTQAIDHNLAPIMTVSYGNCESAWGTASLQSYNLLFQQANAQGITIMGPAGDSGAADCDYQVASATQGLAVDFPASSPYVTAVGGTMFNEGSGSYWAAANNSTYNGSESAISYIPEAVWNESSSSGLAAGGGGISAYFAKPSWQVTGLANDFSRDVPDLALDAAASHDGYLICSAGSCTNGFRNASNNLNVVGGTSVATPNFAGLMALVVQKTGGRVGNANPTIYALANSTYYNSVFHDVTTGTNAVPCTAGSTGCPSGGTIGYTASTGYDLATGWGSVDAYNMVNDWKLVTALGTSAGQTLSTTTVTASAPGATQGTAITITAAVASGVSTPTTTPTGTAQLLVDGTASGSAVALVSGSASFSLTTTSLAAGVHTIAVAYSGDTTYASSKGSVSVDITSASSADFSLTGAASTLTIKAGSSSTVTYTLKSLNNFAGSVTMSATGPSTLNASGGFSVSPVTLTAGSTGTTVFTLQAYVSNATSSTANFKVGANHTTTPPWVVASGGMALASMLLIIVPGRRRRKLSRTAGIFCALLLSITAIGISGCGGSSGLSSVAGTTTNSTPGTYAITITATSGSTSHVTTLTLVVQ